jgi:uncharacterized membrane protein YeaQ/YmgE (transglycosylase-associated protein family)
LLHRTLVAFGTKRHFAAAQQMVALGVKADIANVSARGPAPMQSRIWLGILIGSTIGGFIPALWEAELLCYSALLLSTVGAFVGLWIGYKLS